MSLTPPEGDFRFIALDVETANGDSASICQIGLACVGWDREILTWSTHVHPDMDFAAFNIRLHGIGPETVRDAPAFPETWGRLRPLLARHPMVQHSRFDENALRAACEHHHLPRPRLAWTDSVMVARHAWPELKGAGGGGHGLGNLKKALGLSFRHHDAGEDARAAAEVVLRAEPVLGSRFAKLTGIPTARQLNLPFD